MHPLLRRAAHVPTARAGDAGLSPTTTTIATVAVIATLVYLVTHLGTTTGPRQFRDE